VRRFDPRKDQAVKEFDEAAHVELMGEDADEDQGGADEDADLEVVGGDTEKNARCPYTGKPVSKDRAWGRRVARCRNGILLMEVGPGWFVVLAHPVDVPV
jgi:hypothetical protein